MQVYILVFDEYSGFVGLSLLFGFGVSRAEIEESCNGLVGSTEQVLYVERYACGYESIISVPTVCAIIT